MINAKKTLKNIEAYSIDKYYPEFELKLDSNENPYGPSPLVEQAIRNFDIKKIQCYPAYGKLIEKLALILNTRVENLLLTNGCDEAINVVLNTFLENNDEVLSFSPTFSMPKIYSDVIGANFVEIPYLNRWEFQISEFEKNITPTTKILYLTSPNNPTGEIVSTKDVEYLLSKYQDKLLILDCTYFNYSSLKREDYYNLVEKYNNLVIVKSFSKDYALAGLRIGYIYSNERLIAEIKKVASPYNVNAVAATCAFAALDDIEYFEKNKKEIIMAREVLVNELNKLGFVAYSTEANFILCDFNKYADFVFNKLNALGIKVKYFKSGVLKNFFRITVPKMADVDKLLNAIKSRPLFVFDLDGVVFDVKNSYREAIKQTFKHYCGFVCEDCEMQRVKNLGNMSNDWDLTAYLIKEQGVNFDYSEMVDVFQDLFFVPDKDGSKGLIDNEKNVFNSDFFESLTKFADCAVFTMRPRNEALYSLEKFGIKKYFSYIVCNEDVNGNFKPSPYGLNIIKEKCYYSNMFYFGDTVDDVKAGVDANIVAYGVIPPNATSVEDTKKSLMSYGAIGVIENPNQVLDLIKKDVLCK